MTYSDATHKKSCRVFSVYWQVVESCCADMKCQRKAKCLLPLEAALVGRPGIFKCFLCVSVFVCLPNIK